MSIDYDAVRHLLTEPRIAARTARYIAADDFDFTGLANEREFLSGGERLLVRIAEEIWLAERRAGLREIVRRLDAANFDRVVEALCMARGSYARSSGSELLAGRGAAA